MKNSWIVLTTINPPTEAVESIAKLCERGWSAVVVGDTKTPPGWHCAGIQYLDVAAQRELFGRFADAVPYKHYCRKNLGYLYAIRHGAELILETDDDNIPYESFGRNLSRTVREGRRLSAAGWVNIYKHFTSDAHIWPRGLPLDAIDEAGELSPLETPVECSVQQYLADNDPDVDAVYRLTNKRPVFFDREASPVVLSKGAWVPFNSQNTVFFREAFPLLYLPCFVSFRMTDIWRSFVAQAALSHHGMSVSFHAPTVEQVRNEHDLMKDFADEVVGYLRNREIGEILTRRLEEVDAQKSDLSTTALELWRALGEAEVIPSREFPVIEGWFSLLAGSKSLAGSI